MLDCNPDHDSPPNPNPNLPLILTLCPLCRVNNVIAVCRGICAGQDPHYDLFSAAHGRRHDGPVEYQQRLATFRSNALRVVGHNADSAKPYRMAINRFADWSEVRA